MKRLISFMLMITVLLCATAQATAEATGTVDDTGKVTGTVVALDENYGNVTLSITPADLQAAGIQTDDIVTVSINGMTMDMPVLTSMHGLNWGNLVCLTSEDTVSLAVYSASFALASGIAVLNELDQQIWNENVVQPVAVTITRTDRESYQGGTGLKIGTLAMLNLEESQLAIFFNAMTIAGYYAQAKHPDEINEDFVRIISRDLENVVYYESTDEILMALDSGLIDAILVNESVAEYVTAANDHLQMVREFPVVPATDSSSEAILYNICQNDFAFMLLEEKYALCEEINAVLTDMREDGTLAELIQQYISEADMLALNPVEITRFDGAETIRVAVTGDLPPMDYIREDGAPAGFSTAVLAEIGKRIQKNIELVQCSNVGRALALTSGQADAVFWTRCRNYFEHLVEVSDADVLPFNEASGQDTQIVQRLFRNIVRKTDELSVSGFIEGDQPDNTIVSDAYYSDPYVFLIRNSD